MKLAKLELSGFKSFADYTEFVFDDGVTGIVGPNGCGKSNVVDAVKWVLGEMSAKSLRGDGMLDVIFNGSGGRKPMGMAEVSLTFTNEDRKLPLDAEVVKITRRLYRDATSEYLINNQISRLKDIRELFLDTGIGVDAYSLIEQGRVMSLLESNTQDRREIFEEAAGISRFKARKKEALRKLERTDLNLAQSQLVIDEVDKQLRSVKVQAGRARSYQEYAQRLKELRTSYVLQEYDGLHRKTAALNEKLGDVVDQLGGVRRQIETRRNRQQEVQLELDAAQDAARKAERELLAAQGEEQAAKQRGDFARQQIAQLTEQKELQAHRHTDLSGRLETRGQEAQSHETALAEVDGRLRQQEAVVAAAAAEQEKVAKVIAGLNRSVDENKSRAIDLLRQTSRLNNDINGLKITQESLQNQKGRLETRRQQIEVQVAELKGKVQEAEGRKGQLATEIETLQTQAQEIRQQQQANNQRQAQVSQDLARQREHRSGLASRHNVLKDLQSKREGVSQGVREVLKSRDAGNGFAYVHSIVAEIINTQFENASVIEAALGDLQSAVVVSDTPALIADAAVWQKLAGRVAVLGLDRIPAFQDGYDWTLHEKKVTRATDVVSFNPTHGPLVYQILGKTLIVDSLTDAADLAQAGARGYRFVTRAGEVLEANGAMQLGDVAKRGGIITRRSEMAKLEEELIGIEAVINELTGQISQCDQDSRALDARQQELRQQIYTAQNQQAETNAHLQQTAAQLQRTTAEAPLIAGEMESINRQVGQSQERQRECESRVAELDVQSKQVEAAIHELGSQVIVHQHQVSELSEKATEARVAMGQVQEQRSSLSRALATARQAVAQAQMELQRLAGEMETVEGRIKDAQSTIEQTESVLGEIQQRAVIAQELLGTCSEKVGQLRGEFTDIGNDLTQQQQQSETLARSEHELSLARNEQSVRLETLVEHTAEELGMNLVEAYANYAEMAMDWDAVAAEINELKGKISRLGNVNIDAINEQSSLEERQKFLIAQLEDIATAKKELEELIGKINEDSRARFVETFNAVRGEFQEMFRKLFGGGKADLILENPDDILESGIEILARPPGKELQSISLLSGGEKTMTAVALVMSIFKSKPSPFCILDEVDAALDEANTSRFASIIQEFLHFSQFIVITHNKRTMSVANVLYGVTMQEQGVSKRVAVKFDGKASATVPLAVAPQEQSAAA